jgi:hypothetical protein
MLNVPPISSMTRFPIEIPAIMDYGHSGIPGHGRVRQRNISPGILMAQIPIFSDRESYVNRTETWQVTSYQFLHD